MWLSVTVWVGGHHNGCWADSLASVFWEGMKKDIQIEWLVHPGKASNLSQRQVADRLTGLGEDGLSKMKSRLEMKILRSLAASAINKIRRGTRVIKKINLSALSFATGAATSTQTCSHTVSQYLGISGCVCVSRLDRCHTALMQTCIRQALDLRPRPPWSPLISSHRVPANLPNEREGIHMQAGDPHTHSTVGACDVTQTHTTTLTPQVFLTPFLSLPNTFIHTHG